MPRLTDPKWRELTLTEAHRNDIYALYTEYINDLDDSGKEYHLMQFAEKLEEVPGVYYDTLRRLLKKEDVSALIDTEDITPWEDLIDHFDSKSIYDRLAVAADLVDYMIAGNAAIKDPEACYQSYMDAILPQEKQAAVEIEQEELTAEDIRESASKFKSRKECEADAKAQIKKLETDAKAKQAARKMQMEQSKVAFNAQLKKLKSDGKIEEYNFLKKQADIYEKENKAYLKAQESYEKLQMEREKIKIRAEQKVNPGEKPLVTAKDMQKAAELDAKCAAADAALGQMRADMKSTAMAGSARDVSNKYLEHFRMRSEILNSGDVTNIMKTPLLTRMETQVLLDVQVEIPRQEAPTARTTTARSISDKVTAELGTNRQMQGSVRDKRIEEKTLTRSVPQKKAIEKDELI